MALPTYTSAADYLAALLDAKQRLVVSGVKQVTISGRTYSKNTLDELNAEIVRVRGEIAGEDTGGGRTFAGFQRPL